MTDCHLLSERKIWMNLKPKESYFINFNLIYWRNLNYSTEIYQIDTGLIISSGNHLLLHTT